MSAEDERHDLAVSIGELRGELTGLRADMANALALSSRELDERLRTRTRFTALAGMVAALVLLAAGVVVRQSDIKAQLAERQAVAEANAAACAVTTELRLVLIDSFAGRRDAAAQGRTGTVGDDRVAEVARLDGIIERLATLDCLADVRATLDVPGGGPVVTPSQGSQLVCVVGLCLPGDN